MFKMFPQHFQDALYSNDINQINSSFAKMPKEQADKVMADCQRTGLISILSDEEAKRMVAADETAQVDSAIQ